MKTIFGNKMRERIWENHYECVRVCRLWPRLSNELSHLTANRRITENRSKACYFLRFFNYFSFAIYLLINPLEYCDHADNSSSWAMEANMPKVKKDCGEKLN